MESNNNYNETNRLQELGGSDFEIADNQPNIKGWTIKDGAGQIIGEVDELIFDVQSRKVRYMVVDLDSSVIDLEPRHVLVPIGLADLNESTDEVILPNVTAGQLQALPVYEKGVINRDTENAILSVFNSLGAGAAGAAAMGGTSPATNQEDFYSHNHFNDRNLTRPARTEADYSAPAIPDDLTNSPAAIPIIEEDVQIGKREVETGGARINSRMVEEEVEEKITLREEHVNVERTPVNRPLTDADSNAFREDEIELTKHAEVPVVNKEARVVEEVTLGKEVTERDEVIQDTMRKTEVDVEGLDTPDRQENPDNTTQWDLDKDRRRTDLDSDRSTGL